MPELALAAAQAGIDLAQAPRLGELAEEHRDKVVPARESLRPPFTAGLLDQLGETAAVNEGKELAEEAGGR